MIAQHFIRSPSLRQKLNDQYAGVELLTGLVITVVIILAIFCLSTISGRVLFYLLLSAFIILLVCLLTVYWVHHQKQQLRSSQISRPMTKEDLYVNGMRFTPLNVGLNPGRVTIY